MTDDGKPEVVAKNEYEKVMQRAQNFEAKLADYEKRFAGIDPDEAKANKEALTQLMKERADKGGDKERQEWENHIKADYDKRYGTKFETLSNSVNQLSSEVKTLRVTNVAMEKAASIFNDDALPLIKREVEANCDYSEGLVIVKDEKGQPKPSKKDPRKNMDLEEFLGVLADQYPSCAKAKTQQGGKQSGEKYTNGGFSVSLTQLSGMSGEDQRKALAKMGPEGARDLLRNLRTQN